MAQNQELACRYAQALYRSVLERWLEQLRTMAQALATHPAAVEAAQAAPTFGEQQRALEVILPEGLDAAVRNFIYVLLKERRLHLLESIVTEFQRLIERGPETRVAVVTSAMPLTEEEQEQLRARVQARFGGDFTFEFRVDPQILGGVIIKVGDEVIDGSLASKLAAMRSQLAAAA